MTKQPKNPRNQVVESAIKKATDKKHLPTKIKMPPNDPQEALINAAKAEQIIAEMKQKAADANELLRRLGASTRLEVKLEKL